MLTVGRLDSIGIAFNWRWVPVLVLGTVLLAHAVVPARFPAWTPTTQWLTSLAVVLASEAALVLHELAHALFARRAGLVVERIVLHGFVAETVVGDGRPPSPGQELLVALAGPAMNVALAALAAVARIALASEGALDVLLLALLVGNLAMAAMSLVPCGRSDGARALRALRAR